MGRRHAEALRPLGRPALVLWGVGDPYLPAKLAQRQLQVFPDAEVVMIEDAGHWSFVAQPEAVAERLVPFLSRVAGG
jgi:pimeloyl-ACP methyl ester carboxylesterase